MRCLPVGKLPGFKPIQEVEKNTATLQNNDKIDIFGLQYQTGSMYHVRSYFQHHVCNFSFIFICTSFLI